MRSRGFTLIEVLVAMAVGAVIALLAYQALSAAIRIDERVAQVTQQTNQLQRAWQFLNDDLQHVVARPWSDHLGNAQPSMLGVLGDRQSQSSQLSVGEDSHLIRFVRSGNKNFFKQNRSNLEVVGYRISSDDSRLGNEDSVNIRLWRDFWRPVDSLSEPAVKSRLLLDNIKDIQLRYLSVHSESASDQAWITGWPESVAQRDQLPIAIEITIDLEGLGQTVRLFALTDHET